MDLVTARKGMTRAGTWFTRLLTLVCLLGMAASLAMVPTGSAAAAEITILSVNGVWYDPVDNMPGSQPGDPAITNGDPISSISWGTTSGTQSGYDFIASIPAAIRSARTHPVLFLWERFQHRNFSVSPPSLVSVATGCRARNSRGRRTYRTADIHVHDQPRRNAEQPGSLSLSDTTRRGLYRPGDDCRVAGSHDIQRRWCRLHAGDELPQQR